MASSRPSLPRRATPIRALPGPALRCHAQPRGAVRRGRQGLEPWCLPAARSLPGRAAPRLAVPCRALRGRRGLAPLCLLAAHPFSLPRRAMPRPALPRLTPPSLASHRLRGRGRPGLEPECLPAVHFELLALPRRAAPCRAQPRTAQTAFRRSRVPGARTLMPASHPFVSPCPAQPRLAEPDLASPGHASPRRAWRCHTLPRSPGLSPRTCRSSTGSHPPPESRPPCPRWT